MKTLKNFNLIHIILVFVLQVKVREATSNDPWGPSSTQVKLKLNLEIEIFNHWEGIDAPVCSLNDST